MTIPNSTTKVEPNSAPSAEVNVPPVAPERDPATASVAGGTQSPEMALVRETLAGTAPVSTDASPSPTTVKDEVDDPIEANAFETLHDEFDNDDVEKEPVITPEAPAAVPAKTAAPAAAAPSAVTTEQPPASPAAPVSSEHRQPAATPGLPPEYPNLFAPMTQPQAAPTETPSATGAATPQSGAAAAPAAGETDEQRLTRVRQEYMGKLEQTYAFGDDDARAVMLEPEKVLPKHFAKLHTEVVESALHGILQQLPQVVEQTIVSLRNQYQLNQSFYTAWPQLNKNEFAPTVRGMLHAYRQQNPNANWEQTVREVGAAASVALRLPLPPELTGTPAVQPATQPIPPVAPANPGGGRPLKKSQPTNEFEKLNEEWDFEESLPDN